MTLKDFERIWCVDFEFGAPSGEIVQPRCLCAQEYRSGEVLRVWLQGGNWGHNPLPLGDKDLFVAYAAQAEFSCYLALGWPLPVQVLDLHAEFLCLINGCRPATGDGLLGALTYFGLGHLFAAEKEEMRQLAIRGGDYTPQEQVDLMDYCQSDVVALAELLARMEASLDLPRALIRGHYTKAVAAMEFHGIPIDMELLNRLLKAWEQIRTHLIARVDPQYGVYQDGKFNTRLFAQMLAERQIPWPVLESTGNLDLKDETFKEMCRLYPFLNALRELRNSLSKLSLNKLSVGLDGRNRTSLMPFRSRTGRNQPSTSKLIFGPSVWIRGLIKPSAGMGLAYIDWSQQEFGIAAALSGDEKMKQAYRSGDPYLEFAKLAGAVPPEATKQSHKQERALYKQTVLAVQYGMGAESLALRIGKDLVTAKDLLEKHHRTFSRFWEWSQGCSDYAFLQRRLWTTFGWRIRVPSDSNPRSIANFPMQANGAEMLRIACILIHQEGIRICAPIHDALLIEAPLEELEEKVKRAQELMAQASRIVLDGFELETDADLIRYPDRYCDEERGREFWDLVMEILEEVEGEGQSPATP
jgi:DNA polymerase-1